GVLGVGPAPGDNAVDWDLINAGKQPITLVTGGSYVHHTDSFLMIRGGHLDLALLGAFEVSEKGDLANWTTDDPGFPPGVGGAMDLAVGAKEIRVLVEHNTKTGAPRIRRQCGYPLTAASVVRRIYTDLAVIDVTPQGLVVREMVEDIDFPTLQAKTEAVLRAAPVLRPLPPRGGGAAGRGGAPRRRQQLAMIAFGKLLAAAMLILAASSTAGAKMAIQTFPVLAGAGPHDVYPAP